MKELNLDTKVQGNSSNLNVEVLNDELVIMDFIEGNYILLNKMGKIIWEEISAPILISDLIDILMKKFDVNYEICSRETLLLLNKLNNHNILIVS